MIPYLWDLLDRSLQHPALDTLAAWLTEHVPEDKRRQPLPGTPT
jgi:aminoglycoside/choline kinase family phosphotransferase